MGYDYANTLLVYVDDHLRKPGDPLPIIRNEAREARLAQIPETLLIRIKRSFFEYTETQRDDMSEAFYQRFCFMLAWCLVHEICHAVFDVRFAGSTLRNSLPGAKIRYSVNDVEKEDGRSWERFMCGYIIDSFETAQNHSLPVWGLQAYEWAPSDSENVDSPVERSLSSHPCPQAPYRGEDCHLCETVWFRFSRSERPETPVANSPILISSDSDKSGSNTSQQPPIKVENSKKPVKRTPKKTPTTNSPINISSDEAESDDSGSDTPKQPLQEGGKGKEPAKAMTVETLEQSRKDGAPAEENEGKETEQPVPMQELSQSSASQKRKRDDGPPEETEVPAPKRGKRDEGEGVKKVIEPTRKSTRKRKPIQFFGEKS
ncbi:uncharacterized protein BDZ99DRAFT_569908 [Mytilinidion resinicola]|uniref:SprT-like domain-containing protein n=1 Tax=Mytilinidion resinicola TaxID=574789 RepID=A0A6A6YUA8_9PEZI|nr:uncharacterized protein BDZ99DRAFT_569908 [Mytilinidion resinicola]KAF2811973.1 hypothetical protein BDZ99DRAFT_569908 [Mytilinidion resinicola]